jgi:hypothetical protein
MAPIHPRHAKARSSIRSAGERSPRLRHIPAGPGHLPRFQLRQALWILALAVVVLVGCDTVVPKQEIIINAGAGPDLTSIHDSASPSGRITSIALASDGKRAYAAAPRGGLWRSDDGGMKWHQLIWAQPGDGEAACAPGTCSLPNLNINDVAVSPTNSDLVFAALGGDAYTPWRNGIYRSADGGGHWQLVFQFSCADGNAHGSGTNHQGVDQIVFAPDDATQLWAAGSCGIAYSTKDATNPGTAWTLVPMPGGDRVYHVAVAPQQAAPMPSQKKSIRRVNACGPSGKMYVSLDGGQSYAEDTPTLLSGGTCLPTTSRQSSDIMAVDASSPSTLYVATGGHLYQAVYTYSVSGKASSTWSVVPPPLAAGGGSGSQFVRAATAKDNTTRLFYSDGTSDFVTQPQSGITSAGWYGLDLGKVHVDPHALTPSGDFSLQLAQPPAGRASAALGACDGGFLLVGNDGGLYRSTDCGQHWQLAQGLQTLAAYYLAGIPGGSGGEHAALYVATYDNDAWFSADGGLTWSEHDYCGDCPPTYTDPRLPSVALVMYRQNGPNTLFNLYGVSGSRPDLMNRTNPGYAVTLAYPAVVEAWRTTHPEVIAAAMDLSSYLVGYRPVILTLPGQVPDPNGDYVLVAPTNPSTANIADPKSAVWRFVGQAGSYTPGVLPGAWSIDGPGVPAGATVVQPSGGHANPVYYVASTASDDLLGKTLYRSYRNPTTHQVDGWDCIVPGALHPGTHDGQCVPAPGSSGASDPPARAAGFAADPYDPAVVYVADEQSRIKRSDDGGKTWALDAGLTSWMSAGGHIGSGCTSDFYCAADWGRAPSLLEFSSMEFVPGEPKTRFAMGAAGVFYTVDGTTWHRALSPDALACYPRRAFFNPSDLRSLYVACEGRSLVRLVGIPPKST